MEPERWHRVEQLFHAALQVEDSRRGEFLKQSCAEDENLRREIESLLAHHYEAGSFIESPAFADGGAIPTASHAKDLTGTVMGHYRVLQKIGGGGMGIIYEAEDLRLGRHVALKFLPEILARNPQALRRFGRESRAACDGRP